MSDPRDDIVKHLGAMRAFAISLTNNRSLADDMVQDAVVKAWTKMDTFDTGTNMRAWLFTILRNTFYSHHRKASREVSDGEGHFSSSLAQKPDHDGRLELRDFNRMFQKLPAEQREALILVGASGFSYEEAASTCGVAVGTIKSRVNRARARLTYLLDIGTNATTNAANTPAAGSERSAS